MLCIYFIFIVLTFKVTSTDKYSGYAMKNCINYTPVVINVTGEINSVFQNQLPAHCTLDPNIHEK